MKCVVRSVEKQVAGVLCGVLRPGEEADVAMCNPPFYDLDETGRGVKYVACSTRRSQCARKNGLGGWVG